MYDATIIRSLFLSSEKHPSAILRLPEGGTVAVYRRWNQWPEKQPFQCSFYSFDQIGFSVFSEICFEVYFLDYGAAFVSELNTLLQHSLKLWCDRLQCESSEMLLHGTLLILCPHEVPFQGKCRANVQETDFKKFKHDGILLKHPIMTIHRTIFSNDLQD